MRKRYSALFLTRSSRDSRSISLSTSAPDLPAFFGPLITLGNGLSGVLLLMDDSVVFTTGQSHEGPEGPSGRSSGSGADCDSLHLNSSGVSWPRLE